MKPLEIKMVGPWSFRLAASHLQRSSLGVSYAASDKRLRRVLSLSGQSFLVDFSSLGDTTLSVSVFGDPSGAQLEEAGRLAEHIFARSHPLESIYGAMGEVSRLKPLIKEFHGLRILQAPNVFEIGVSAIIGQQVNVRFANTIKRRLIGQYGEKVSLGGETHQGFPSADTVAKLKPEDLRPMQLSQRKAEYVIDFAGAFSKGRVSDEELANMPDKKAYESLLKLRGIGSWTANIIMMRALNRLDVLPSQDVGLQRAYAEVFKTQRPSNEALSDLTADWKGFRSYATFYLWATLSNPLDVPHASRSIEGHDNQLDVVGNIKEK